MTDKTSESASNAESSADSKQSSMQAPQGQGRKLLLDMGPLIVFFIANYFTGEFMLGVDILLPDELEKIMVNDFLNYALDAQGVVYASDVRFYQKAVAELFPDNKDIFRMVWKVFGWPGKFLDRLDIFCIGWIFSGLSGKFPDSLESFQIAWKVSR